MVIIVSKEHTASIFRGENPTRIHGVLYSSPDLVPTCFVFEVVKACRYCCQSCRLTLRNADFKILFGTDHRGTMSPLFPHFFWPQSWVPNCSILLYSSYVNPWVKILLVKLLVAELVKKFPRSYRRRENINESIVTLKYPYFEPNQSMPTTQPTLILFFHLCLGLPSCTFPTKNLV
jgi:hypothetical protein